MDCGVFCNAIILMVGGLGMVWIFSQGVAVGLGYVAPSARLPIPSAFWVNGCKPFIIQPNERSRPSGVMATPWVDIIATNKSRALNGQYII
jgi:hypothetical protein